LNAHDYNVPQDRRRVIIIGYNKTYFTQHFTPPLPYPAHPKLSDAIADLAGKEVAAGEKNQTNKKECTIPNHEYMTGGFSSMYMSRNRVRGWDEPSFTIQAGGRHAPLHPQAPKLETVSKDIKQFAKGKENLYRRLTVRECARIQTFPDDFIFYYKRISSGYKMAGNAVPVKLAEALAIKIREDIKKGQAH
jgi:DNA (cytosine-5)-methyltransferase 1